jgi:hypothetical protein
MLNIRSEQLEVFNPTAERAFQRRVVEYLRENHAGVAVQFPDGVTTVVKIPEDKLSEIVRIGLERARNYGMTWESSLCAFVVLMFVAAPNFDEHPLIERVLKDESVEPDSRIDQLWERTSEQNWEAVKQKYDAKTWHLKLLEGDK